VSFPGLQLLTRFADLVGHHPWLFLLAALVVGLIAPARVRRIARVTAMVTGWSVVILYMLPLGAFFFGMKWMGLDLDPANSASLNAQLRLPLE